MLRAVNKQNRSSTLRQASDKLKETGLEYGSENVSRWFKKEGVEKVARRMRPSLSEAQQELPDRFHVRSGGRDNRLLP